MYFAWNSDFFFFLKTLLFSNLAHCLKCWEFAPFQLFGHPHLLWFNPYSHPSFLPPFDDPVKRFVTGLAGNYHPLNGISVVAHSNFPNICSALCIGCHSHRHNGCLFAWLVGWSVGGLVVCTELLMRVFTGNEKIRSRGRCPMEFPSVQISWTRFWNREKEGWNGSIFQTWSPSFD